MNVVKILPGPVRLIISGGQSGADLAGNEFAKEMGIATRCYIFPGFITTDQKDRDLLEKFECVNIKVQNPNDYVACLRDRTLHNVKCADATVIVLNRKLEDTRGSRLTWSLCESCEKPYAIAYIPDWVQSVVQVSCMINNYQPKILNVAGERNLDRKVVKRLLRDVWKEL